MFRKSLDQLQSVVRQTQSFFGNTGSGLEF
jgi:hypothetical protein